MCLFGGTISFLAAGLALDRLDLSTYTLIVISYAALATALWMIGAPAIQEESTEAPRWDLPVRMLVATGLVLLITSIANVIGPGLSGLAATFPLFAIVLAVFAHKHHGAPAAQSVFRGLVLGLFGFVGFFAAVALLITRAGLTSAFLAALVVNFVISAVAYPALRRSLD